MLEVGEGHCLGGGDNQHHAVTSHYHQNKPQLFWDFQTLHSDTLAPYLLLQPYTQSSRIRSNLLSDLAFTRLNPPSVSFFHYVSLYVNSLHSAEWLSQTTPAKAHPHPVPLCQVTLFYLH